MTNEELERKISALAIPAPPTVEEILAVTSQGLYMQIFPVVNEAETSMGVNFPTYPIHGICRGIEIGMRVMQARYVESPIGKAPIRNALEPHE